MDAEFNWWLLIVGLVVGAGLVWLVVLDSRRRETDVDQAEMAREALWLSMTLRDEGTHVSAATTGRLLQLHRAYLESPPPDDPEADAGDAARPMTPFDQPVDPQERPSSTGSASIVGEPTSTSETPNVAGPSSPATASEAPAQ